MVSSSVVPSPQVLGRQETDLFCAAISMGGKEMIYRNCLKVHHSLFNVPSAALNPLIKPCWIYEYFVMKMGWTQGFAALVVCEIFNIRCLKARFVSVPIGSSWNAPPVGGRQRWVAASYRMQVLRDWRFQDSAFSATQPNTLDPENDQRCCRKNMLP